MIGAFARIGALSGSSPFAGRLTLAAVFFLTVLFGFAIQAVGSAYLRWIADPIASEYKTTLSYTSAIVGDGILLPLANVFMISQLTTWRQAPRASDVAAALLGGAALTAVVHLYQAANALLNWTMLAPYSWTPMGYLHAAYMACELSLVFYFCTQLARRAAEAPRSAVSHRVLIVALCCLLFLRLLLGDYGYVG